MITIALAKGRLADKAIEILEKCGIESDELKNPSRKLILKDNTQIYNFIFGQTFRCSHICGIRRGRHRFLRQGHAYGRGKEYL